MIREITLNLLGIKEIWFEKKTVEPKLLVCFENLSKEGLILLNNILFSINITIDKEQIQLIEKFYQDNSYNNPKFKTLFLTSSSLDLGTSKKIFFCPHPDEVLKNSMLKIQVWEVMVALQKTLNQTD